MSRSSLLRAADVRAMFQFIGECCELGDDPTGWRRHLLAGVARRTGAAVTVEYEGEFLNPFRTTGIIDWGWETSGFNRSYFVRVNEEYSRRGGGINPVIPAYFAAVKEGRGRVSFGVSYWPTRNGIDRATIRTFRLRQVPIQ